MSEAGTKSRPQFKNIHVSQILRYRMPMAAKVSILHRISGVMIFLLLPFVLYLLDLSITTESTFEVLEGFTSQWFVKLVILGLAWGYLHHFCAGVRHLFMDAHWAADKDGARKTANGVMVVSLVLTALVALKLFGAF